MANGKDGPPVWTPGQCTVRALRFFTASRSSLPGVDRDYGDIHGLEKCHCW
jgi:hypothetical protein